MSEKAIKIRVVYTIEVSEAQRRKIRSRMFGDGQLATRHDVAFILSRFGIDAIRDWMTADELNTEADTLSVDAAATAPAKRSARRCLECRRVRALQPDGLCRECAEHNEADHEPDMAEDY